jgi:hypothetical protein
MAKASKDLLERLHEMTAQHLLDRIDSGEATASEIAQAVKMLKDNGIDTSDSGESPLGGVASSLADKVPFSAAGDPTSH